MSVAPAGRWPATPGIDVIAAPTKTDHAYLSLRRKILDGELAPGDVLDQEALAATLSLSTTPIREALRRLESERLIVSRAHRSTEVAPLSFESLEQTYAIRIVLDTMAVELATEHATEEQIKYMKETAKLPRQKDDPLARLHKNRAFHRAIYASCGNDLLVGILDSLWDISDRYRIVVLRDAPAAEAARSEHDALLEAVISHDREAAGALMREHMVQSLITITRLVGQK
jgi:DNA-binding GntR family transcriptional regulator